MRKGFTLAELIIVIGISIFLTSILIIYTRSGEKQIVFFKEQALMQSSILRAKNFSIETFQPGIFPGIDPGPSAEKVCGWGVHFDKNSARHKYIIFRDLLQVNADNCVKSRTGQQLERKYDNGELFEEFVLPPSVQIESLTVNGVGACQADCKEADVIFIPPDPITFFYPDNALNRTGLDLTVKIKLDDGSRESEITVSKSGQISFK